MAPNRINQTKRDFIKTSSLMGSGLIIGCQLPGCSPAKQISDKTVAKGLRTNTWIHISYQNQVTVWVSSSEMGQGVYTALPTIIAEELEISPHDIIVKPAPAHSDFANPKLRVQVTGGSTSTLAYWEILQRAGAMTREQFKHAASISLQVPITELAAENGAIIHAASGKKISYGALIDIAKTLSPPTNYTLKNPAKYKYIGKPIQRVDIADKVLGKAVFGIDVVQENMLFAYVLRGPYVHSRLVAFDAKESRNKPGVESIFAIESGIAVVASTFWQAKHAAQFISVEWKDLAPAPLSTSKMFQHFDTLAKLPGTVAIEKGKASKKVTRDPKALHVKYRFPYLAHATMEPMNCTAHVQSHRCDIWAPTQNQTGSQHAASHITNLPLEAVFVHTTLMGGGFGRRGQVDFVKEAVQIAKRFKHPVKVIWTREDDMKNGFFRPISQHHLSATVDKKGYVTAWRHKIIGPSIMDQFIASAVPDFLPRFLPRGFRHFTSRLISKASGVFKHPELIEGAKIPYQIEHVEVSYTKIDPGVPVGFWRSVGHSYNAMAVECFIDELAFQAGIAPYSYRKFLLSKNKRMLGILEKLILEAKLEDQTSLPPQFFQGLAVHQSFGSYVGQVATIKMIAKDIFAVTNVTCVTDCGQIVNPAIVKAQMESGIIFGLSALTSGKITIENSQIQQTNFDDYPVIRMEQAPEIVVHLIDSKEKPGGVGEIGTPPIAPAVINALFKATGKRYRNLPLEITLDV